jgi:hypothetical protein
MTEARSQRMEEGRTARSEDTRVARARGVLPCLGSRGGTRPILAPPIQSGHVAACPYRLPMPLREVSVFICVHLWLKFGISTQNSQVCARLCQAMPACAGVAGGGRGESEMKKEKSGGESRKTKSPSPRPSPAGRGESSSDGLERRFSIRVRSRNSRLLASYRPIPAEKATRGS